VARVTRDGVSLYYEQAGSGETVAFVGEAGYGAWQWGWQHDAVAGPFEALVWDLRGTGRSDAPPSPYDVDTLAADLEAVLSDSGARRAHLVGAGLGGMVALRHARKYDRTATLSLCGVAPGETIDEAAFRALHAEHSPAIRASLAGAFSASFCDRSIVEQICEWRAQEDASAAAFEAQAAAALEFEPGPLYEQQLPTVVYHGVDDPVVPVPAGRHLAADLPRGTFEPVEGRHLCFIEHARAVNDHLVTFLDEHTRG